MHCLEFEANLENTHILLCAKNFLEIYYFLIVLLLSLKTVAPYADLLLSNEPGRNTKMEKHF